MGSEVNTSNRTKSVAEILDTPMMRDEFRNVRTVQRYKYMPYSMDRSIEVVKEIGKKLKPTFAIDADNRFLFENLIRWVHGDPEFMCIDPKTKCYIKGNLNAGIYIAGPTGTGKTWALEIMSMYTLLDEVRVNLAGKALNLRWPSFRTDQVVDEYQTDGKLERFKKNPIICFQDLGAEVNECLYMGTRLNVMQQVIGYRGDRRDIITLFTSNFPINHKILIDKYDARVTSRLREMCNYFELNGQDRRTT